MRPEEHRHHILGLLRQHERISVDELTRTLSTPQETIRRDLVALAEQSLIGKFHGGTALPPSSRHRNALQTRMNEYTQEERAVTRYAAGLFRPGDSIFIDTGTTTLLFACELAHQDHLTMITNSLLITGSVGTSGNRAFMIGDEYRPKSEQNVDVLVIEQIARFNAEHAVIAVNVLNGDGAIDLSIKEAEIARAMIARARQLVVIADSLKLGRYTLFRVFPLSRINRLVVDHKPTGELWEALQQTRVEIYEAPLRTPQA